MKHFMADTIAPERKKGSHHQLTTHCKNGHLYTEKTTYLFTDKYGCTVRSCRICKAERNRIRRAAAKNGHISG